MQGNSSHEISKEAIVITQQRDQSHLDLDGGDAGCEQWWDFKSNRIVHRSDMSYGKKERCQGWLNNLGLKDGITNLWDGEMKQDCGGKAAWELDF